MISQKRWVWVLAPFVSAMLLACANLGGSGGLPVDSQAPDFGIKLTDKTVAISDMAGQVIVANFWSST